MRRTFRQLAAIKPSRYLEAGSPTGLTGLYTHATPRSTLLYLYSSTLEKLEQFPESSLYRQSTEAVTKHRMQIVSSVVPEGYEAWATKARQTVADHPEVFTTPKGAVPHDNELHKLVDLKGNQFVQTKHRREVDETEWDGEFDAGQEPEGPRTTQERKGQADLGKPRPGSEDKTVTIDPEPQLTIEQIGHLENEIGAGLIEEVIQVAKGELLLTDVLIKSEVWSDLEEAPKPGQWEYFKRAGTPEAPPS